MAGLLTHRVGLAGGAAPTPFTLSAFQVGVSTGTNASVYNYTATGLPGDPAQVIVVFAFAQTAATSSTVTNITGDSGAITGTSICRNTTAQQRVIGCSFLVGVTGTSSLIEVTFGHTMTNCVIGHMVITGTTQTTYSSRSGAGTFEPAGSVTTVTSTLPITIPTGGVGIAFCAVYNLEDQIWTQDGGGSPSEDADQSPGAAFKGTVCHSFSTAATEFTCSSTNNGRRAIGAFSWAP